MTAHGWVKPFPSGVKAPCGGPDMCAHCKAERIAVAGCPVDGDGRCFYCRVLRVTTDRATAWGLGDHTPDCAWVSFAEAFS